MGNRIVNLCPTELYDEEPFDQAFEVDDTKQIGAGKFSTVHLCWRRDDPDAKYALKVINAGSGDVEALTRIREEIEILQVLGNHQSIIQLVDVDESTQNCIRIVMELCEGGELYDRIQSMHCYTEQDAKALVRNLLEATSYIHSKGVMHRDLKPENILLASKTNNSDIKISDFGLAKMSRDYPHKLPRSRSICGSDFYLAPEVIKQEEYGREIDIWAIGVITYVTLSGTLPFFHQVLHKLYRQIVERDLSFPEEAWRNVSKGGLDFILRLLQVRAADRLSADQALSHDWLRGPSSGSSFGGSFRELANLASSMPRSNSTTSTDPAKRQPSNSSTNTDLQRVLKQSYSNAHPLAHATKVNDQSPGPATPAAPVLPQVRSSLLGGARTPFGAGVSRPPLPTNALQGQMIANPSSNFAPAMQVQSRGAQPIVFR